jgi:hypothetical protein
LDAEILEQAGVGVEGWICGIGACGQTVVGVQAEIDTVVIVDVVASLGGQQPLGVESLQIIAKGFRAGLCGAPTQRIPGPGSLPHVTGAR